MAATPVPPGAWVQSRAGRDAGTIYLVVGTVGERLLVADGKLHSTRRPKRKNPLHVSVLGQGPEELLHLAQTGKLQDHELRRSVERFVEEGRQARERGHD